MELINNSDTYKIMSEGISTEDTLRSILENLEMEQTMKNKNETISYINQPEKLAISSNNGIQAQVNYNGQYQNAFYNFTVNLPRPALGVKSIELLSANIPQCQVSIPDESLIFYYFKLRSAVNSNGNKTIYVEEPSIDNIHYIRLLPSYYKQELVEDYLTLAFNRTFNSYKELAAELEIACSNDLYYVKTAGDFNDYFIPNDISITYEENINKFQFTGNNTEEAWPEPTYTLNPASVVQIDDIESYENGIYISLEDDNSVNPALIIYTYTSGQVFNKFNIANVSGTYYTCIVSEVTNVSPPNLLYWLPSTYDPDVNYGANLQGFNVYYNGYWYVSITNATNTGQTPNTSPLYWRLQPYSGTTQTPVTPNPVIMTASSWLNTLNYQKGNIVNYGGLLYRCLLNNVNQNPSTSATYWAVIANTAIATSLSVYGANAWNSLTPYDFQNVVSYSGTKYIQIYPSPVSNYNPSTSPTIWQPFTSPYLPTGWQGAGFVYQPQEVVLWTDFNFYVCKYENNNIPPLGDPNSSTYWYLATWNSSTSYNIRYSVYPANWLVIYNNKWYSTTSTAGNTNKQPDINATYWNGASYDTTNIMDWWEVFTGTTGYTYLSAGYEDPIVFEFGNLITEEFSAWDFDFNGVPTSAAGSFIASIPPQPLVQYQTLNLRLGFTWDGVYTWTNNFIITGSPQDITQFFTNGSIPCMLFNRLRPVPYYQVLFSPSRSRKLRETAIIDGDPYTSTTYTADAFANLVYSSIINIYTNIIGPSTTDTERNVNLLDTAPLNCNNLGITFYNPVISNKLTKIPSDMYSIYFEFRKEDGTEYYFSNNAIITLTLGLTYK